MSSSIKLLLQHLLTIIWSHVRHILFIPCQWEAIKFAIRRSSNFRFDYFLKSLPIDAIVSVHVSGTTSCEVDAWIVLTLLLTFILLPFAGSSLRAANEICREGGRIHGEAGVGGS